MSYETGTATSQADLITKLFTFLTGTPGWTQDQLDTTARQAAIHKGTVYVQFKWNSSPDHIGIYHSLNYIGGNSPGNHTNDSGNGDISGVVDTDRMINAIGAGPSPAYHFFADGSYFHAVLEYSSGIFRHFGAGIMNKVGTWTGGEYCYGHYWEPLDPADPIDNRHSLGLDAGLTSGVQRAATLHVEGLPDEGASSKWAVIWGATAGAGNDRAGNARVFVLGGLREGFLANAMAGQIANPNNGYVAMHPIHCYYRLVSGTPNKFRFLGSQPHVRALNMKFINVGEEFSVGGETWKVFPWVRKNDLAGGVEGSGNLGLAYRKIT